MRIVRDCHFMGIYVAKRHVFCIGMLLSNFTEHCCSRKFYIFGKNSNFGNSAGVASGWSLYPEQHPQLPLYLSPISITPSMPPVPAELVSLVAQSSFIDFKLLLPSNLSVIAAQPIISLQ